MASSGYNHFLTQLSNILHNEHGNDSDLAARGDAVLSVLSERPDEILTIAHEKLHSFPYKDVPICWRRLYTEATLWQMTRLKPENWLSTTVKALDMAIILTGAPGRYEDIQSLLGSLGELQHATERQGNGFSQDFVSHSRGPHLPESSRYKRRKITSEAPTEFPAVEAQSPVLHHPLPRSQSLSLGAFEKRLRNSNEGLQPFIITGAIDHWPAICDVDRSWANPQNLLDRTLGGRRRVPVELGRSYTDENWGQRIMSFGEYLERHMLQDPSKPESERQTGYLAQHDLFAQVPELRSDICIPDYCYANMALHGNGDEHNSGEDEDDDDVNRDVMLNAWFGPAHTISPLHTDPHHNILAQVVGHKYVRLYGPAQTGRLYPRSREGEVDMSNTSLVDIDLAMKAFEGMNLKPNANISGDSTSDVDGGVKDEFMDRFPAFFDAQYVEGVLGPGDCLFVPRGWWHFIRSMSASCSVSFWWD